MSMSDSNVIIKRIYFMQLTDRLAFEQSIKHEKVVDRMGEWERQLFSVYELLQNNQRIALETVIKILMQQERCLTQKELLRISSTTPGLELDEGAMKKALSFAVKKKVLNCGRGRRSEGYALPVWD